MFPCVVCLIGRIGLFIQRYNLCGNISNDGSKLEPMSRTAWNDENIVSFRIQIIENEIMCWGNCVVTVLNLVDLDKFITKKLPCLGLNPFCLVFQVVFLWFQFVQVMSHQFEAPFFVIWHYERVHRICFLEWEWVETTDVVFWHVLHLKIWNVLFYHIHVIFHLGYQFR